LSEYRHQLYSRALQLMCPALGRFTTRICNTPVTITQPFPQYSRPQSPRMYFTGSILRWSKAAHKFTTNVSCIQKQNWLPERTNHFEILNEEPSKKIDTAQFVI
jgi:hypothetical protein